MGKKKSLQIQVLDLVILYRFEGPTEYKSTMFHHQYKGPLSGICLFFSQPPTQANLSSNLMILEEIMNLPSLKLTRHLKMDGWNTIVSFGGFGLFSVANLLLVLGRVFRDLLSQKAHGFFRRRASNWNPQSRRWEAWIGCVAEEVKSKSHGKSIWVIDDFYMGVS